MFQPYFAQLWTILINIHSFILFKLMLSNILWALKWSVKMELALLHCFAPSSLCMCVFVCGFFRCCYCRFFNCHRHQECNSSEPQQGSVQWRVFSRYNGTDSTFMSDYLGNCVKLCSFLKRFFFLSWEILSFAIYQINYSLYSFCVMF